jgi:hypothetical protein
VSLRDSSAVRRWSPIAGGACLVAGLVAVVPAPPAHAAGTTVSNVLIFGFTGPTAEVAITGSGFGSAPPPSYPTAGGCGTGSNYASNLYLQDLTRGWEAGHSTPGVDADCVGLVISSWSDTKVVFGFGSDYNTNSWVLYPGDSYALHVLSAVVTGTVTFMYPTVAVSPGKGPRGVAITLRGKGFMPGEAVKVKYNTGLTAPAPAAVVLCSASVAGDGTFACGAHIPSGATAGAKGFHLIVAKATPSKLKVTTSFCLGCAWIDGDMLTYAQSDWTTGSHGGQILLANYDAVYAPTLGVFEIGIHGAGGFSAQFTDGMDLLNFLPADGVPGPFDSDLANPMITSAGVFGGEVAALKLNVDYSDAGALTGNAGLRFGDLRLCNVVPAGLSGVTVRQALDAANTALGAGPTPYAISDLNTLVDELNFAFESGSVEVWAEQHLVNGACP